MTQTFQHIPQHVAIIMDGNGRWAKNEGRERLYGHMNGVESVRAVVKTAAQIGVKYLTLYAFSTENWGRPAQEVEGLMRLLSKTIAQEIEPMRKNGIKFNFIGDVSALGQDLVEQIEQANHVELDQVKMTIILAINYSSRWEITDAVKKIVTQGIPQEKITEDIISQNLQSSFIPDPDILIRTSGEQRLSNFLLWQLSYTELYFTTVLWPEFGETEFLDAISEYNLRERRFGLTI